MDSYSGRFPLDFIYFHLEMPTEARDTEDIMSGNDPNQEVCIAVQTDTDHVLETRPLSNLSSSSGATEKSPAAYAERTLQNRGAGDANSDVSFLNFPGNVVPESSNETSAAKVSGFHRLDLEPASSSHSITENEEPHKQPKAMDKPQRHSFYADFFATDTREVEDMIDNEGVVGVPNRAAFSIVWSEVQTTQDEVDSAVPELPDLPQASTSYSGPRIPEQLSANGRAVLRKFFSKASPRRNSNGSSYCGLHRTSDLCHTSHDLH